MANTYTLIASSTVGAGGTASITFSSIPATYTDLLLKLSSRELTTGQDLFLKFNSSSSGHSSRMIYANPASGVYSQSDTNNPVLYGYTSQDSYTANVFGSAEIYIPNYASSNYKSFSDDTVAENNASTAWSTLTAGLWSNTAAITSITLTGGTNFTQYTTAYLYGIKNS